MLYLYISFNFTDCSMVMDSFGENSMVDQSAFVPVPSELIKEKGKIKPSDEKVVL